jgi:hypothetical protein
MKAKGNYCWTSSPQVDAIGHIKARRFVCALFSALLVADAWIGTAQTAIGQDVRGFVATAGVNEDGDPVIDFLDSEGTCVEAVVPQCVRDCWLCGS